MEHWLEPARACRRAARRRSPTKRAAPALRQQRDEVGECLAEPEHEHVGAGREDRQVLFGGVPARHVREPVLLRERGERGATVVGQRVEVAEREHDDVCCHLTAVVEDDRLAVAGVEDVDGRGRVPTTSTVARKAGDDLLVEPVQVHRLHAPSRERHLGEAADLVVELGRGRRGAVSRRRRSPPTRRGRGRRRLGPCTRPSRR